MCAKKTANPTKPIHDYRHPEAQSKLPPDVGAQARFRDKRKAQPYRYDSSLAPELQWDGQNPAREEGEHFIAELAHCSKEMARLGGELAELVAGKITPEVQHTIAARQAEIQNLKSKILVLEDKLRRLSRPFLNWTGKAERLSFDVPTLPLFVHERLSTQAIIEGLQSHTLQPKLNMDWFGDPRRSLVDQVLKSYEYTGWINRLILGDSLVVMNSLLNYEALGGKVQMIYIDPPYGVKFGSNFQPFVRNRAVDHNDDDDFTREPEVVQAYRDTWELGLHSYLTYLRDRLLLSRELLNPSGSIFIQISNENLHHVCEILSEVFGEDNSVAIIPFRKKTMPLGAKHLESVTDYLIWFAKDIERLKFRPIYEQMSVEGDPHWNYVELADGTRRKMTQEEINNHKLLPSGSTPFQLISLYPAGLNQTGLFSFHFRGKEYRPPTGNSWFTHEAGMKRLAEAGRIEPYEDGKTLRYVLKLSDSPITRVTNLWADMSAPSNKIYAVQTSTKVIQRCMLMTTDPGDLILDPTCGSGTTAYVAEEWGRRWIAIDTSRVPLALARQRLLTTTLPWYELANEKQGPAGGFVYQRKQNRKGEEIGGIIPYITKGSIANTELPAEKILVDRPEEIRGITRIVGPFRVEATIPRPLDWEESENGQIGGDALSAAGSYVDRMIEVLRRSPVLHVGGNKTVTFKNVRPPAKSLALSAEALLANGNGNVHSNGQGNGQGESKPVAFVFGPENGAVSERLVTEAIKEAYMKSYQHLYVIGFAIQPNARITIENAEALGVPATYVQATLDLQMGDLLKHMRSSQIFSVAGLPEIAVKKAESDRYQVELLGLDVFDPVTMEVDHRRGDDVPAWFLDTDYNGLCFYVHQAFFPRTSAWDNLKRALKGNFHEDVWEHLAGTTSEPFAAGENRQIAVKVIDDRGNELLVVKPLP